ncbi:nitroimidazol reductase NimA-like FMN-containing flavoprotein (pyridoxamine 5'-phosphate oxidase superfamily) [Phycicoccus badiiscoriae]|uniref:Nitroimidazol reductase NimA-like FMN-containing flavoprotein (Pyridoxamine 5'-phosphate oxidase superfamily) n=1 Tax=Pedococcus badiiscoriae TaxID=642776 RepID=A0A852WHB6_9MICO|nr:pyridoxamine 5'-phosphate oxidase family protein [Pedococcus badiiscoriae]NYG05655.1 nitroimidazol reductase NimA-like FMN-containing flavoprotein (pyridoxamine 5'-phosphate oxidase superfamily) [Pedococcus badiiscoriae]
MTSDRHHENVPTDHTGLRVLTFDQCLRRLAECPVGRIAFVLDGEIAVLPVNHTVLGLNVYFRTLGDSKIEAAVNGDRVSFEVDAYNPRAKDGWSVLVHGTAEVVSDREDLRRLEPITREPWVPADSSRMTWIRVRSTAITGRALWGDEGRRSLSASGT